MKRETVDSSQIKSIGFDEEKKELEVEFKPGSIYRYSNFTQELFNSFLKSESKGKFFGKNIKPFQDKYPFIKIRATDKQVEKQDSLIGE